MPIIAHTQRTKKFTVNKSCRMFERSYGLWKNTWDTCSDERCRKNFRVTQGTFGYTVKPPK